jgi:hypothetical protein
MAGYRVWQPLGENTLAANIRGAEKAADSEFDLYWNTFPGQVGQLALITAVNLARSPTASGTAALFTDWPQYHYQPASSICFQFMQRHFSSIGNQRSAFHRPERLWLWLSQEQ